MKNYYIEQFQWIFAFRSHNFFYCVLKVVCILVGLPIHIVLLLVDLVNTLIYSIFSFIPILNTVFMFLGKIISLICHLGFFICILPDIKKYRLFKATALQEVSTDTVADNQVVDDIVDADIVEKSEEEK
ncbi:MAG: hypothetical protein RR291_01555 [Clostridia bacterium]